jgi:uncharacterized protein
MKRLLLLLLLCNLVVSCREKVPGPAADPAYAAAIETWQKNRQERLRQEDSWFTVVGLWWLDEGENPFGSAPELPVRLPEGKAPLRAGSFVLAGGKVTIQADPSARVTSGGEPVTVMEAKADTDEGGPTEFAIGRVSFHLIRRDDRVAVRVKDPDSKARQEFEGLEYFPVDQAMRIEAEFAPYDPPKEIPIANVVGQVTPEQSPGAIVFDLGGQTYRLDPIAEEGSDRLFVIFADATSGRETYGAGRYLYTDMPRDGKVVIDFNKAYNPPCAFTAFATCPLPPRQNKLPVRVAAGEKAYHLK